MSIPAILGGALIEIPDAMKAGLGGVHWTTVAAGVIVAGLTGYFAVKIMIAAIKKKQLWGFAAYTAVLGVLVIIDQYVTHYFF
ncbi:Undecaprenyl-diphosphatase [bioreactor metagenome]|uniref:Undecaprenyl-diphosphatase n=1 Tax=bioreactor metagenome TaxID=1076179 RepID=A0A644ZZJ1_9ZZZZ